jgi:hypothetical protein
VAPNGPKGASTAHFAVDDASLTVGTSKFIGLKWAPTSPTRRIREIGALLFLSSKEEQGDASAIGDIRTLMLR